MNLRYARLGGAFLAAMISFPAVAAPQGWYLGLGAGWSGQDDTRYLIGPPALLGGGKISYGDSAAVDLTAGYKFEIPLRAELEVRYVDFNAEHLIPAVLPPSKLGGDVGQTSFFANMLYDIPLSRHFALNLGGGVGATWEDPSVTGLFGTSVGGSQTLFTGQLIAGMTVVLSSQFELQADYRYQWIDASGHVFGAGAPIAFDDKTVQSAMLSLRWYLEQAAPPPPPPQPAPPPPPPLPPPPAPAPVKTFIVFFDFDKSDLTAQAQQIVASAVNTAKTGGIVRVLVTGHTDTVGSETYNLVLSNRRADAVKAQMISDGLSGNEIATVGKGFSAPLIQTGPGVREPQNRRAVIDLGG